VANSLGTLTLDLVARIGAFTGSMDKAKVNAQKNMAAIGKAAEVAGAAIGGLAVAGAGAFTALIASSIGTAKEISNLSSLAGLGTTEFQKYAAGAASVGIQQDKLSDIFKDTSDKMGEFISLGSGGAKDFFDNIAPLVGVTADQFKKLNGPEALELYVSSLQKANVNQSEMTFYMEAIANDSTALVPLLKDNGKAFKELGEQAAVAGAILDEKTIAAAKGFSAEMLVLEQYVDGAKTQIAAQFLPVLAQFSKDVADAAKEAGGLGNAVQTAGGKVLTAVAFIVNAGDGVTRVFDIAANTLVGLYATAAGRLSQLAASGSELLAHLPGATGDQYAEQAKAYRQAQNENMSVAAQAAAAIKKDTEESLAGDALVAYVAKANAAAAKLADSASTPLTGEGSVAKAEAAKRKEAAAAAKKLAAEQLAAQKKADAAADAAAKKLQDQFESTETGYEREIQLINTTSDKRKDASEVSQLAFELESGKLVGINAQQQQRLKDLASELDAKKKLKQQNEDDLKVAAFAATLENDLQIKRNGNAQSLAGLGLSDKDQARLQESLAVQQKYVQDVKDLNTAFQSDDISEDVYKRELDLLKSAKDKELAVNSEYYEKLDEAQNDWLTGVGKAWANYAETASNYSQIANEQITSQLNTLQGSFGDAIYAMVMENQSLGDSFRNIVDAMVASLIKGLADMVAQWLIHQAIKLAIGTAGDTASVAAATATGTAIAAAYAAPAALASLASFGANSVPATAGIIATTAVAEGIALSGMAHDGIDSVPQDGTWLLQKGERVTTAQTSAKLDKTLADLGTDSSQRNASGRGKTASITQNINVNGVIDNRTSGQLQRDAARKQRQASRLN